jgi:hypothetical protein
MPQKLLTHTGPSAASPTQSVSAVHPIVPAVAAVSTGGPPHPGKSPPTGTHQLSGGMPRLPGHWLFDEHVEPRPPSCADPPSSVHAAMIVASTPPRRMRARPMAGLRAVGKLSRITQVPKACRGPRGNVRDLARRAHVGRASVCHGVIRQSHWTLRAPGARGETVARGGGPRE